MILIIDNYDSFTHNLVQRFGELDARLMIEVYRNDQITIEQIEEKHPTHLVVSPGPCTPTEAGISNAAIRCFAGRLPILGVCLGHQCIGQVFDGDVVRHARVVHGKTSPIFHDGTGLFLGLSSPFHATRYHSLVIRRDTFTHPDFVVNAWTAEGDIMAIRHVAWPLHGLQFHPESFLTIVGPKLLRNFLNLTDLTSGATATPA